MHPRFFGHLSTNDRQMQPKKEKRRKNMETFKSYFYEEENIEIDVLKTYKYKLI